MSASTPLDRKCETPGCDAPVLVRLLTAALACKDLCRPCAVRLWSFCRAHGIGVHGWPLDPVPHAEFSKSVKGRNGARDFEHAPDALWSS